MSCAAPVAVFDLDVTLTRYDTFLPFLIGYLRRHPRRTVAAAVLPLHLLAAWRWGDRDWLKTRVLTAVAGGQSRRRVSAWAEIFIGELLQRGMRASGVQRLRWHQERGDRVILASASFDVYVQPLARRLGIDEVVCSRVRWDNSDRLAGIDGHNCLNEEKLRRVKALLGERTEGSGVTAYSDSHADLPLLRWAETGIAVCPSRRLTHQVAGLGLEIQRW